MAQYDSLKEIIAEAKSTAKPLVENMASMTLPELKDHHKKISDHIIAGEDKEYHPEVMAKLRHVHERLTNTIHNVESEIDQHREMAEYHDENSYGAEHEAPYGARDFSKSSGASSEVRSHLTRINDSHEEIASHHGEAAEFHRQAADELENGDVEIPEEHVDNTPFDAERHGKPSPNDP